jgi:DNA-binding LytR/AlgR family response regulator
VKIHPESGKAVLTREKISKLQAELPANFIRIHRSFIVNTDKIENFNREQLEITDTCLPISRTYRKAVWKFLSKR